MRETKYDRAGAATANRLGYDEAMGATEARAGWSDPVAPARGPPPPPPAAPPPAWVEAYARTLGRVVRALFPATTRGFERLPDDDAFLIVANHSGLGIVETVVLGDTWLERCGPERRLAGMAHPALFGVPGFAQLLRALGAVEATRVGAAYARERRAPLLLFPGGDHESMRPLWRAREVDFAGRTGWIRLAREHRLRIVPLAITGSHVTVPNLAGTRALAWLTGARVFGMRRGPLPVASVLAVLVSLARSGGRPLPTRALRALVAFWGAAFIPWVPSKIGLEVLEPLSLDDLARDDDDLYADVTGRLAAVLGSTPARG